MYLYSTGRVPCERPWRTEFPHFRLYRMINASKLRRNLTASLFPLNIFVHLGEDPLE